MTLASPQLPPPLAGGRYVPLDLIGEGGMAQVYKVMDRRLGVERAVKLLDGRFTDRGAIRKRFLVEARTMARLTHPNIVRVQDIVAEDERIFIVMDLLPGGTVWDRIERSGPYPADEARQLVADVADAVSAAHLAGVVHRDIKPQNILLDDEGNPCLTDFGIALVNDEALRRNATRTGTVMGTWGFMPPEQRHDAHRVDERADVYALGATLWSMLRGKTPTDLFAAEMEPTILSGLPPELAELIRVATRYRPEDRFQSAEELAMRLRRVTLSESSRTPRAAISYAAGAPETVYGDTDRPFLSSRFPAREDEPNSDTLVGLLDEPLIEPSSPSAPASRRLLLPALIAFSLATGLAVVAAVLLPVAPPAVPREPALRSAEPVMVMPAEPVPDPRPPVTVDPPPEEAPTPLVPTKTAKVTPAPTKPPPVLPPESSPPEEPPEASPTPEPVNPATVSVRGEVDELWLVDSNGEPLELGSVPPGEYRVKARFPGSARTVTAGVIRVGPGEVYVVHCDANFKGCK